MFLFFQICQEYGKQCVMTADAENATFPGNFKEQWPQNSFSRHCALKTDFD
jgi:hypothetical protein